MARPPKVIKIFKGVNKLDRFSIGENYAMDTKNLTSDKFPALTVRPGQSVLGSSFGTRVLGLGVWKDIELHAVFNDGTWRKWNGSSWSSALVSGLNTTAEWSFTNFKGSLMEINLIGTNGVDTMRRYDGTTVSIISDAPSGANYVTSFTDRVWCAVGNELRTSAYRDATDWTTVTTPQEPTDSWYTNVETADGEQINGVRAGLSKLTITKPSSIHHLYGYDLSDYEVRPKTFDYGAFNNKCMEPLKGQLHMLDENMISKYDGGILPDNAFSDRVQYYIDNINQTAKNTSCIGTDGQKLYVSIPMNSSTNPDTVLVYDTVHDTWFVWDNITALHFARIGNKLYIGDATGNVHQLTGTTDNGSAISWNWVMAPVTAPSMAQLIRWFTAWETAKVSSGSTSNVYISPTDSGDTDWTLVRSIPSNGVVESTSIYLSAQEKATLAKYMRAKFSGTGTMDLYEFTREEDYNPLR